MQLTSKMQIKIAEQRTICYKNFDNRSCLHLLLTHSGKSFESTYNIETELLDSHTPVVTVLKEKHKCLPSKIKQYKD